MEKKQSQRTTGEETKSSSFSSIASIIKREFGYGSKTLSEFNELIREREMYKKRNQLLTEKMQLMEHQRTELEREVMTKFKETISLMNNQS